jgi:hypothetical protein
MQRLAICLGHHGRSNTFFAPRSDVRITLPGLSEWAVVDKLKCGAERRPKRENMIRNSPRSRPASTIVAAATYPPRRLFLRRDADQVVTKTRRWVPWQRAKAARHKSIWPATVLLLGTFLLGTSFCAEGGEVVIEPIRFAQGASKKTVSGAVIRSERALYSIKAGAGQHMSLSITAIENNAVFQVYPPGARPEWRDSFLRVSRQALPGAAESDGAVEWEGDLPQNGTYLVVVGPIRGNATYTLTVVVH